MITFAMGRRERTREEAHRRYPALVQFLGSYLYEDSPFDIYTPQQAVDDAIANCPVQVLRQARSELVALLEKCDDDVRLRSVLNDGLGICVYFRRAAEARSFALDVESRLLAAIQAYYRRHRMKG